MSRRGSRAGDFPPPFLIRARSWPFRYHMRFLPSFLLCLAILPWAGRVAAEEWRLLESEKTEATPVWIRKTVLNGEGRKVSLNLCLFHTRDYTLKVVDQGDDQRGRRYANLQEAMEKNGCVAGVNGGFYGQDFQALGAVVEDGEKVSPYVNSNRGGLASGVLWSGTGGIHIVRRQFFSPGPGVDQAIQTGPMLVSGGRVVPGLSGDQWRPRTFVLTNWRGDWMLGTSSSVSLAALAEILNSPRVITEMTVDRAINLDGGRSTGFYLKQSDGNVVYRPEFSRVRNFLGIVPKDGSR